MKSKPLVTAIIVNYNASLKTLKICLESLQSQTYKPLEILVVDNGSTNGVVQKAKALYTQMHFIELGKNYGFAEGVNQGIKQSKGEFFFLLNNDAQAHPEAVKELLAVIKKNEKIAGVAPKMMFSRNPHIFDSIGTLIDKHGAAFNRGIGQVDIGQYDPSEEVFGVCFGGALLRKVTFNEVGWLDSRYFMYYEDVDWCYRANLLGYKFYTAPKALVYHLHSASTKEKFSRAQKYYLIQRNLLRTVIKDFELRRMVRTCLRYLGAHLNNILIGHFRSANFRIILSFLLNLPCYLVERRKTQRYRKVSDVDIFKYSSEERPCFDPVTYTPIYSLDTLEIIYKRLFRVSGDPKYLKLLKYFSYLNKERFGTRESTLSDELRTILSGEPESIQEFVEKVEG